MKKNFTWLCMSALAVSCLLFAACDDDDDEVINSQEEPDTPVVVADPTLDVSTFSISLPYGGGTSSFTYVLRNSVDGGSLKCTADESWLSGFSIDQSSSTVSFDVAYNQSADERTCVITLTYTYPDGELSQSITATQEGSDLSFDSLIGTYHSDGSMYCGSLSRNYGSQKWVTRIHWNADKTGLLMEGVTKNTNREHDSSYDETYMAVLEPDFSGDTLKIYIHNQAVEATYGTSGQRGYCAMSHVIHPDVRTYDYEYDKDFFLYYYEEQGIWTSILHEWDGDPGNVDGNGTLNNNYSMDRENKELGLMFIYWKSLSPLEVGGVFESSYKWEMVKVSDDDEIVDGYTND